MSIPPLHKRIFEIAYKYKLSHLTSSLSSCDIINYIYNTKKSEDIIVLSAGHGGLGLYVNLERHEGLDAEQLYLKHKTHPHRDINDKIWVSSGSLGCGITIALGMAMANKTRDVHVVISDGESWEGSVYEALMLKNKLKVNNLKVWANINGFSGIEPVDKDRIAEVLHKLDSSVELCDTSYIPELYPFLKGIRGHYTNLTEEDWNKLNEN